MLRKVILISHCLIEGGFGLALLIFPARVTAQAGVIASNWMRNYAAAATCFGLLTLFMLLFDKGKPALSALAALTVFHALIAGFVIMKLLHGSGAAHILAIHLGFAAGFGFLSFQAFRQ